MAGVFVAKHGEWIGAGGVTGVGLDGVFRRRDMEKALASTFRQGRSMASRPSDSDLMADIHASSLTGPIWSR